MKNIIGKTKNTLDTPCLVIDNKLLQQNIDLMQHEANVNGKKVRPHVKTHKSSEICKMQIAAGAIGISAAKVSEAKVLADAGIKNILITSPVVTSQKIENLQYCLQLDSDLTVVIDNLENAAALNNAAKQSAKKLNVVIDIDPGIGRTGIAFTEILEFAKALLKYKDLNLKGIQCYAGNLQHIISYPERQQASLNIMQKAADCVQQLRTVRIPCEILTGSGTGTYDIDSTIPEVTEIQPGSYTVMDAEYYLLNSTGNSQYYNKFKPAMTLLTTVISANCNTHVTCDAGWKTLYQVPTKPIVLNPKACAYDWAGFGDEHGKITAINGAPLPKLGDVLELMVAHCDPTINLFDTFYIVEDDIVVNSWPIDMRGKSQ